MKTSIPRFTDFFSALLPIYINFEEYVLKVWEIIQPTLIWMQICFSLKYADAFSKSRTLHTSSVNLDPFTPTMQWKQKEFVFWLRTEDQIASYLRKLTKPCGWPSCYVTIQYVQNRTDTVFGFQYIIFEMHCNYEEPLSQDKDISTLNNQIQRRQALDKLHSIEFFTN